MCTISEQGDLLKFICTRYGAIRENRKATLVNRTIWWTNRGKCRWDWWSSRPRDNRCKHVRGINYRRNERCVRAGIPRETDVRDLECGWSGWNALRLFRNSVERYRCRKKIIRSGHRHAVFIYMHTSTAGEVRKIERVIESIRPDAETVHGHEIWNNIATSLIEWNARCVTRLGNSFAVEKANKPCDLRDYTVFRVNLIANFLDTPLIFN